jgi:hypothetical protein
VPAALGLATVRTKTKGNRCTPETVAGTKQKSAKICTGVPQDLCECPDAINTSAAWLAKLPAGDALAQHASLLALDAHAEIARSLEASRVLFDVCVCVCVCVWIRICICILAM